MIDAVPATEWFISRASCCGKQWIRNISGRHSGGCAELMQGLIRTGIFTMPPATRSMPLWFGQRSGDALETSSRCKKAVAYTLRENTTKPFIMQKQEKKKNGKQDGASLDDPGCFVRV